MSSSSDDEIGQEVEERLPAKVQKRRWTKRLPIARRQEAIELKLLGKEDPEFHVIEREKKGSYIVRKRAHPLKPTQEPTVIQSGTPVNPVVSVAPVVPQSPIIPQPEQKLNDIPVLSYFNNQNSVNTSLSSELKKLTEMYERLEEKYVEVKKTLKKSKAPVDKQVSKKHRKVEVEPDDEPTEEEILAYEAYLRDEEAKKFATQIQQQPVRRQPNRRVIDINKF
jgi:hypothetical protein